MDSAKAWLLDIAHEFGCLPDDPLTRVKINERCTVDIDAATATLLIPLAGKPVALVNDTGETSADRRAPRLDSDNGPGYETVTVTYSAVCHATVERVVFTAGGITADLRFDGECEWSC